MKTSQRERSQGGGPYIECFPFVLNLAGISGYVGSLDLLGYMDASIWRLVLVHYEIKVRFLNQVPICPIFHLQKCVG